MVEPNLRLVEQAYVWAVGFVGLVVLLVLCGRAVRDEAPAAGPAAPAADDPPPTWRTKLHWLGLSFVPSSLMLAITTDVTTDLGSEPLLWIVPLSLYLLTFVIVFSKYDDVLIRGLRGLAALVGLKIPPGTKDHVVWTLIAPVLILPVVFVKTSGTVPSFGIMLALYMVTFFAVAMACHGELVRTRPSAKHLTSLYLTMSVGGMLGGLFNALVVPLAFDGVSEFPITLVIACFVLPPLSRVMLNRKKDEDRAEWTFGDLFWPLGLFLACRLMQALHVEIGQLLAWFKTQAGVNVPIRTTRTVLVYGLPVMACYAFVERPRRFAACVAAVWLASFVQEGKWEHRWTEGRADADDLPFAVENESRSLGQERSFFGVMKIDEVRYFYPVPAEQYVEPDASQPTLFRRDKLQGGGYAFSRVLEFNRLVHGTTLHGMELKNSAAWLEASYLMPLGAGTELGAAAGAFAAWPDWENDPDRMAQTYYHRTGPVGAIMRDFKSRKLGNDAIAVVGLGTGSMACYVDPGHTLTFFEIDPAVRTMVESGKSFTFVNKARAAGARIDFVMGDARLELERSDRKWGILFVDAFSSDSVPAHLLTKQAIKTYFDKIEGGGMVVLHVSNRYLRLEQIVYHIAAELGIEARQMDDGRGGYVGKTAASWIALAKDEKSLGGLAGTSLAPARPEPALLARQGVDRRLRAADEHPARALREVEIGKRTRTTRRRMTGNHCQDNTQSLSRLRVVRVRFPIAPSFTRPECGGLARASVSSRLRPSPPRLRRRPTRAAGRGSSTRRLARPRLPFPIGRGATASTPRAVPRRRTAVGRIRRRGSGSRGGSGR